MNYEKLTPEQQKKLRSIEKRIKAINKEIKDMGFNVYLANSTLNIMDGPSHLGAMTLQENVVHCFNLNGWGGGDW